MLYNSRLSEYILIKYDSLLKLNTLDNALS